MIELFVSLVLSIFFWTFSTLLSQSPISKELLLLINEVVLLIKTFFLKIFLLVKLLIKDLFLGLQSKSKLNNFQAKPEESNNLVSESDYPYRISEIFKDLS
tara:strand:- start:22601 stop:22903 length:303 start_codon:yes stop_codon:yes gene_type:complete